MKPALPGKRTDSRIGTVNKQDKPGASDLVVPESKKKL